MDDHDRRIIEILYTGETGDLAKCRILPIRIFFGKTPWHDHEQWILEAHDIETELDRAFALKEIQAWLPQELQTAPV